MAGAPRNSHVTSGNVVGLRTEWPASGGDVRHEPTGSAGDKQRTVTPAPVAVTDVLADAPPEVHLEAPSQEDTSRTSN